MAVRKVFFILLTGLIAGCLISCGGATREKDIQVAMTYVAETQAVESPTPAPTLTSLPQPSATLRPTFSPEPTPEPASTDTKFSWQDAGFYHGERVTVCGPVVGTHYASSSNGHPTFLNLGEDYPSPDRFVVVIWGENREQFPDDFENDYYGETICVTGEVEEYEGVYQMEVERPGDVDVE